jgi:DNA invertase Pin-like site-specific DNA recombinase
MIESINENKPDIQNMIERKTKLMGIYARVSTDEQNIDQQLQGLKEYCRHYNIPYRSFSDFAVSGKSNERPEWKRLIKACEGGDVDTIFVHRLDRITRDLKFAVIFWDWMKKYNIRVKTVSEGDFLPLSGDNYFVFMLKCLLSEKELMDLDYRRRIGIERAKKEGGKYKGRPKGAKDLKKRKVREDG